MSDLPKILGALQEALQFWSAQVANHELKPVKGRSAVALVELVKIAKLIRAHTTKVGIIFEPTKLAKLTGPAVSTVKELSESFVALHATLAQLEALELSELFCSEIYDAAKALLAAAETFTVELTKLHEEVIENKDLPEKSSDKAEATDKDTVNPRLVSVGKIWKLCDDLVKFVESGKLKVLEKKTRMHLGLIEDGLDEFAEWAENPQEMDDDPFGLDLSDSEDDTAPPVEKDETPLEDSQELIHYSKAWLQKFKLVKLLFLSINKSLDSLASGDSIDSIAQTEAVIAREIDLLIVELMLNQVLDDKVDVHARAIDKACARILATLKAQNKDDKKIKWCATWKLKYDEQLAEMYDDK